MKKENLKVNYYVYKFEAKMRNSVPSDSAWWIDGISELNDEEKNAVYDRCSSIMDWHSRDRGAEHEDLPDWLHPESLYHIQQMLGIHK